MSLKVKVNKNGIKDIVKFTELITGRNAAIEAAPATAITAKYKINEAAKAMHPHFQEMEVAEIIDHKDALAKSFIMKTKNGKPAAMFRAGQYISVLLKIGDSVVTRPYSVSSSPMWTKEGKVAITVKSNKNGFAADWMLENINVGDTLLISGGEGQFYYEPIRDKKNVVALAGGSGITPFLSMAYAIRDGLEDFNLTVIFGSRDEKSILFKEEFDKICKECDKVKIVHVLSNEKKKKYENGFITADIIKKYAPEEYSIFICGPEAMYRFLEEELKKLELPRRLIRRELLGVTHDVASCQGYPEEAVGKTFKLTVKQFDKEYVIDAKAEETILTAIERAGISAPSRCRSGECGWCRARLLSGKFFAPEENEYRKWSDKKFDYVHPCCTFPLSDITIEIAGSYLK